MTTITFFIYTGICRLSVVYIDPFNKAAKLSNTTAMDIYEGMIDLIYSGDQNTRHFNYGTG